MEDDADGEVAGKAGRNALRLECSLQLCVSATWLWTHVSVEADRNKHMKSFPLSIINPQPISFRISSCLLCLSLITPVPLPPNGMCFGLMHSHLSLMFIIDGINSTVAFIYD